MRDAKVAIRTTDEIKKKLVDLAEKLSGELGTKISQTQAVEIAISEALAARARAADADA